MGGVVFSERGKSPSSVVNSPPSAMNQKPVMSQKLSHFLNNSNFKGEDNRKKAETTEIRKAETTEIRKVEKEEKEDILTIKDGKIVINETGMYIRAKEDIDMEVLEDDRIITSNTYTTRRKSTRWNKKETEVFYKGLEICGLEFSLLESLFNGRDRRQIKAKYLKELKINKEKVENTLKNKKKFNPHEFTSLKEDLCG